MRTSTWLGCLVVLALGGVAHAQTAGNAWHIPSGAEPGIATMRSPVHGIVAGTEVAIYSGNQFQGAGNVGNQLQTGSAVIWRHASETTWTTAPMAFASTSGNNKYFVASLPGGLMNAGDTIYYYLQIAYSDHSTTFVYGGDAGSQTTLDEPTARAGAFAFGVDWPLQPSGAHADLVGGNWQARVYTASGHVGLVGGSGEIDLAPPHAMIGGNWLPIGAVTAQAALAGGGLALTQQLGGGTITAHVTFPSEGVLRYEVVDWGGAAPSATQITAASDASEHFYGFGEKFDGLDQAGKSVHVLTSDFAGDKGDHSYKVAPWFVSSKGYGVHLDSTAEAQFDMRASAADRYVAQVNAGALAVNLVGGPTPSAALGRFTGYVGRPAKIPAWAMGTWISSDVWHSGGEVRYVVGKFLAEKISASVFVFDSPWELAYNDFAWNTTQFAAGGTYEGQNYPGFASPADMMAFLRASGLKVVLWMTPFVDVTSNDEGIAGQNLGKASIYDAAAAAGYFVRQSPGGAPLVVTWWKGQGSPIDFTNPAARSWLAGMLQGIVTASGGVVGGWKTDDGEGDYIPLTASYADGRTGAEMKNGYCVEYLKTVWGVLGEQGMLLARSGFVGTQSFPGVWAGDNEPNYGTNGLPSVVSAALSAAMTGYALWGSDIGGYQDVNPSSAPEDLFMRWTQFGALTPIMQMHRQVTAGLQYPWSYGQAGLDNYRAFAQLHTTLFPYLYTAALQAHVDGTPIIRPLPLVDGSDANGFTVGDEYALGDALLVAPVVQKQVTSRAVYLPMGVWHDYWTGAVVAGGATVTWTGADATTLPLYVREGSIVARLPAGVQSLNDASYVGNAAIATPDGSLDLLVTPSPAGAAHVTLYDATDVTATLGGGATTIAITSAARALQLEVYAAQHPTSVTRDGVALVEGTDWMYAAPYVTVKFAHGGGATQLVLDGTSAPDGGAGGGPGKHGGCGCRTGGARGGEVVIALGVLLLVVRRRRPAR